MKVYDVKKIICVIFLFGFLAGIIYLNLIARPYVMSMGIFNEYFLEQYSGNKLNTSAYIMYIIKIRFVSLSLLIAFINTYFKRIIASIFLLWTGFACGVILTTSILKLGLIGIGLCIVGAIPHYICYVTIYIILIIYIYNYPSVKWNATKTISVVLFMLLGIITEVYINPVLMDIFIKMI